MDKELREIISSTKFAVTFGVCSMLIVLSFYIGGKNFQVSMEQYEAGKRENLRTMEGMTDWADVREYRILLPPQPIASLVMGVSNDIGRNVEVRGRGELTAEDSRYGEDPIYAVFRFVDLEFIFQIVLSLFAILFAYDSVNGEKERGTLRLTFANSISRSSYILGKILGSFAALAVPLLVPIMIGMLVIIAMGVPFEAGDWARLSLVVLAGYLYFGAFLAISLFVSSSTERSSSSFLLSLIIWILSVMIVPRTAVLLAGRAIDVPSVNEISSQKSRYSASLWQEDRRKMADFRATAGTSPDQMIKEFQKLTSTLNDEREKKERELADRLNEERENKQALQAKVAFGLARISPSATFSLVSSRIAGTGLHLEQEYKKSAEEYQIAYAEFMKEKMGMTPGGGMVFRISVGGSDEKKVPINPAEIPEYRFHPMPVRAIIGDVAVDLGILALFNVIFFVGAFVSFLRYDVR